MTWSRFDDAARKHPKAVMAGNEAWGFWCAAIMYCNQYGTDGFVPDAALHMELLPCPITKSKARLLAERCCRARLQPDGPAMMNRDEERKGYTVHDFLDWNPSKSELESQRKADRDRKRRVRGVRADSEPDSDRSPDGRPSGQATSVRPDSDRSPSGFPPGVRPESRPESGRSRASARALPARPPAQPAREEIPLPPSDPFGDSLRGRAPEQREDVAQVHERWKHAVGWPHHAFRAPYDSGAKAIATCIDADGLENALIVAEFCMNDGMVNGKQDEKRQPHTTLEYIFGKSSTFHRILAAALAAGKGLASGPRRSASEAVAAAKALGGGT